MTSKINLNVVSKIEPRLTIQSLHQCSSLISIKLDSSKYLLGCSQIQPLIRSLGIFLRIIDPKKPENELVENSKNKVVNSNYSNFINNDGLLVTWLLGTMSIDILNYTFGLDTTFLIWSAFKEHLLPATKEKQNFLIDSLMGLKKGDLLINEFIKRFSFIYENLVAICKPVSDIDKYFYLSHGLVQKIKIFV